MIIKVIFFFVIVLSTSLLAQSKNKINFDDCTFNGLKLYGKVKIVENFPDIKVQIVDAFPDIEIQIVESFPKKCGQWKFVDSFPDLKVKIVNSFPDIKIKFVENFPGKP